MAGVHGEAAGGMQDGLESSQRVGLTDHRKDSDRYPKGNNIP